MEALTTSVRFSNVDVIDPISAGYIAFSPAPTSRPSRSVTSQNFCSSRSGWVVYASTPRGYRREHRTAKASSRSLCHWQSMSARLAAVLSSPNSSGQSPPSPSECRASRCRGIYINLVERVGDMRRGLFGVYDWTNKSSASSYTSVPRCPIFIRNFWRKFKDGRSWAKGCFRLTAGRRCSQFVLRRIRYRWSDPKERFPSEDNIVRTSAGRRCRRATSRSC